METAVTQQVVKIHIDHNQYESPSLTSGTALYQLGNVGPEHSLYKVTGGDKEGEVIENDSEAVLLHQGDRFQIGPRKTYRIIVNGQVKTVTSKRISFEQLVKLAYPTPLGGENILYSITYSKGPHENRQGTLRPGENVKVHDGMIFNVTATDKS